MAAALFLLDKPGGAQVLLLDFVLRGPGGAGGTYCSAMIQLGQPRTKQRNLYHVNGSVSCLIL